MSRSASQFASQGTSFPSWIQGVHACEPFGRLRAPSFAKNSPLASSRRVDIGPEGIHTGEPSPISSPLGFGPGGDMLLEDVLHDPCTHTFRGGQDRCAGMLLHQVGHHRIISRRSPRTRFLRTSFPGWTQGVQGADPRARSPILDARCQRTSSPEWSLGVQVVDRSGLSPASRISFMGTSSPKWSLGVEYVDRAGQMFASDDCFLGTSSPEWSQGVHTADRGDHR